jgi:hypothetical protein
VPIALRNERGKPTLYVAIGPQTDRETIGRSLQERHEEEVVLVLALEEQIFETLTRLYGPDPDAAGLDSPPR